MADGWIKLHRMLLDKPIWKASTPEQKTILITLLLMVWHRPNEWEWGGKQFKCEPGQCVTSLDSIVKECGKGISTKNVRTALERFEKYGFLANESAKQGRLITIANWELYQDDSLKGGKGTGSQVANDWQTGGKQVATNKNVKNERMEEDINSIKDTICQTDVQRITDTWNQTGAPEVKRISSGTKRYQMLKARMKEYGMDQIVSAIESIKDSSFLLGQNKNGWMISFDWFVKPNNFLKVFEGNYLNGKKEQSGLEEWIDE